MNYIVPFEWEKLRLGDRIGEYGSYGRVKVIYAKGDVIGLRIRPFFSQVIKRGDMPHKDECYFIDRRPWRMRLLGIM